MKIMKRIAAIILAVCIMLPGLPLVAEAADGRVSFTDPQTKTGETVEVACALRVGAGTLDTFEVTLKYDPAFLAYESGDEGAAKESDGVVKFSGKGDGTGKIRFTMKFQALQTGTTKIEVSDASGSLTNGEIVTCTNGNSTIQIAQGTKPVGEPAGETGKPSGTKVTVGEQEYTFSETFKSTDIPVGFAETKMIFDGAERKFVQNETATIKLGYLVNTEGKGAFFLYNEEDATFSPYTQVAVSPTTSIALLKADSGLKIPDGYQEVKLNVNEHQFPAWQDSEHEGFYLVYAINTNGEKGFYQYDTKEESYQRFIAKEIVAMDTVSKTAGVSGFLKENSVMAALVGCALSILLLIVVIVLSVRLRQCNLELDDLYEELDLEDEEDEGVIRLEESRAEKRSQFKKRAGKADADDFDETDDFDEFDNLYTDEFDDFAEEYEAGTADDVPVQTAEEDEEDEPEEETADDEFVDDDEIVDFDGLDDFSDIESMMNDIDDDEPKESQPRKKADDDLDDDDFDFDVDDFEIDFIDLD